MKSLLSFVLFCVFLTFLSMGCSKKVEISATGQEVCPYCKIKITPFSEFCTNCKHNFRYTNKIKRCWSCEGKGICKSCKGSARITDVEGSNQDCTFCKKTGECSVCSGTGEVEHGTAPIKTFINR